MLIRVSLKTNSVSLPVGNATRLHCLVACLATVVLMQKASCYSSNLQPSKELQSFQFISGTTCLVNVKGHVICVLMSFNMDGDFF